MYSPIIFCQGDKPDAGKPSPRHAQTLTQEMQGTEVSGGVGLFHQFGDGSKSRLMIEEELVYHGL